MRAGTRTWTVSLVLAAHVSALSTCRWCAVIADAFGRSVLVTLLFDAPPRDSEHAHEAIHASQITFDAYDELA